MFWAQILHNLYQDHVIPLIATVSVPLCQNVVVSLALKQSMKLALGLVEVS